MFYLHRILSRKHTFDIQVDIEHLQQNVLTQLSGSADSEEQPRGKVKGKKVEQAAQNFHENLALVTIFPRHSYMLIMSSMI